MMQTMDTKDIEGVEPVTLAVEVHLNIIRHQRSKPAALLMPLLPRREELVL
jgi:hypothetical protein